MAMQQKAVPERRTAKPRREFQHFSRPCNLGGIRRSHRVVSAHLPRTESHTVCAVSNAGSALWHLKLGYRGMRRDPSIFKMLREALQQAARNLQSLKMVRPDDDPDLARLKHELLAATSLQQEDPELALTGSLSAASDR